MSLTHVPSQACDIAIGGSLVVAYQQHVCMKTGKNLETIPFCSDFLGHVQDGHHAQIWKKTLSKSPKLKASELRTLGPEKFVQMMTLHFR